MKIEAMTRSAFLARGAVAVGAAYGTAAVGPFVGQALAKSGAGDVDIVNFALTLEYLEAAFYAQAVKHVPGLSGDLLKLAQELRDDEDQHVAALTATVKQLGGRPVAAPGVDFGGAFASRRAFVKTAIVFEETGVSAYNGAAPAVTSADVLGAAGAIVQVEARHASLMRLMNDETPAPLAFDKAADKATVLTAVKPFLAG